MLLLLLRAQCPPPYHPTQSRNTYYAAADDDNVYFGFGLCPPLNLVAGVNLVYGHYTKTMPTDSLWPQLPPSSYTGITCTSCEWMDHGNINSVDGSVDGSLRPGIYCTSVLSCCFCWYKLMDYQGLILPACLTINHQSHHHHRYRGNNYGFDCFIKSVVQ